MDRSGSSSAYDKDIKNPQSSATSSSTSEQIAGSAERVGNSVVGGVTHIAADLVHGMGTLGSEMVTVVRDTANSAIAGVGSVGETAVHTVTHLFADLVGGLRDIGSAAMHGRAGQEEREEEMRRRQEEVMH